MASEISHAELALELRRRVEETGIVEPQIRAGAMAAGSGRDGPLDDPYRALALMIGADSYRVTDQLVDAVRDATGSDKATFEVVMAASVGAGLRRWDAAARVIGLASDATR